MTESRPTYATQKTHSKAPRSIKSVPLEELKNDLAEMEMDIEACRKLLFLSQDPDDRKTLQDRIDVRVKLIDVIHQEQARRVEAEKTRQP